MEAARLAVLVLLHAKTAPEQFMHLAPVSPPPQIVFLEQPYDWVPVAANILQFILLAALTYYIFFKQYRQKTMERQAEWYHRVVTDFAIEKITAFTEASHPKLASLAKEVAHLKGMSAPEGAIAHVVQQGLAEFKESLYHLSRIIRGRLLVFEKSMEQSFAELCDGLEDSISEWFSNEATAAPGESRSGVFPLLNDWQSNALKLIRDYEFDEWN